MNAREPDFFDIWLPGSTPGIDEIFVCFAEAGVMFGPLSLEQLAAHFPLAIGIRGHTVLRSEFDAAFVECQSVPQMADSSILVDERKVVRYDSHRGYGVPIEEMCFETGFG